MRHRIVFSVAVLFVSTIGMAFITTCSNERKSPTNVSGKDVARSKSRRTALLTPDWVCSTKADIDTALTNYSAGDVVYIVSNTYTFSAESGYIYDLDKSVTIYGDGDGTVLNLDNTDDSDAFFNIYKVGEYIDFVVRDMKFDIDSKSKLFRGTGLDSVVLNGLTIDVDANGISESMRFSANNLIVDNCKIDVPGRALTHTNNNDSSFTHVIKNTTFTMLTSSWPELTYSVCYDASGSVTYKNNTFDGMSSGAPYHTFRALSDHAVTDTFNLFGNDLADYKIVSEPNIGSANETIVINYDDNHETYDDCDILETIKPLGGSRDSTKAIVNIGCWVFDTNGNRYCDEIEIVSGPNAIFVPYTCEIWFSWFTNGWCSSGVNWGTSNCNNLTSVVSGPSGTQHYVWLDASSISYGQRVYYEVQSVNACAGTDTATSSCGNVRRDYCFGSFQMGDSL